MRIKHFVVLFILLGLAAVPGCRKDEVPAINDGSGGAPTNSPVVVDLEHVPYATLSEYGFFVGPLANLEPAPGVLPYEVITPGFGDYSHKFRYVWIPPGSKASYVADGDPLDFSEGTVLMKTPFYPRVLPDMGRQILDTRLLIRKNGDWIFAEYIWNEDQTEAVLDMAGKNVPLTWVDDDGGTHDEIFRIPSAGECLACHAEYGERIAISPKPQNLDMVVDYPEGPMNQLAKWAALGYLESGYPTTIDRVARWDDPDESLERRVRAYLDMNCSHCHNEGGFCGYRSMRFAWQESGEPASLGVCVAPDDPIEPGVNYIVQAGNAERSMLWVRLNSTNEAVRMPLLERTVRHDEAVQLVADWINAMTPICP